MAEPIRPKFCVGPSWPQERFITNQNFQKLNPNKNKFSFGFKNHRLKFKQCHAYTYYYLRTMYILRTDQDMKNINEFRVKKIHLYYFPQN